MSIRVSVLVLLLSAAPALAFDSGDSAPDPNALMRDARAAIDRGAWHEAINDLTEVVDVQPRNADALNLLGYASRKAGDLAAAAGYYDRALSIDPDHLGALEYQGELFVMQGDLDAARANLARLAALCGNCEEQQDLAEALADAGA